ncbi:MAG TPA: heparin lyase I family protein [Terriglobales bacterium]|nr:heparin lyase I family protein [Terriglobales bacterium]
MIRSAFCRMHAPILAFATLAGLFWQVPGVCQGSGRSLWSADHETGDLSQWNLPGENWSGDGGGEFNSGTADSRPSQDYAKSGKWSVRMTINTAGPSTSGTRLFRWAEPLQHKTLRYSAWFYFPRSYSVPAWWIIFQWKSKRRNGQNDPFYVVNVGNREDGSMYLYLYDWQNRVSHLQKHTDLPVGRWFQLEAEYSCAADETGSVAVWQDGVLLFEISGTRTRYTDGDCQWSVNNYSDKVIPSPAVIYVDDASIRTVADR